MIPGMRHIASDGRVWSLLIAILALVITSAAAPPEVFDGAQAGGTTIPAQLAPSVLPTSPTPTAADADERILSPFPIGVTETMTETVRAILAVYTSMTAGAQSARGGPIAVPNSGMLLYLPAIQAAPAIPPIPTPRPTPHPSRPADLALTIWPSPSIIVMRGDTLAYELRVKNYGRGRAKSALVTLPYNCQQLRLIDAHFTDPDDDWVSDVAHDHIDVTFGPVVAGEYRTATLVFRVNAQLPDRTVISMRASYAWDDNGDGGSWQSNWAPVLIGPGNESAPWVWTVVDPIGGFPGTTHYFFTDRFIPGEGIYTWLNTPTGVQPLDLHGIADGMGRVWLDFRSTGLTPGSYQMVLYGARSNLTGVATFIVW